MARSDSLGWSAQAATLWRPRRGTKSTWSLSIPVGFDQRRRCRNWTGFIRVSCAYAYPVLEIRRRCRSGDGDLRLGCLQVSLDRRSGCSSNGWRRSSFRWQRAAVLDTARRAAALAHQILSRPPRAYIAFDRRARARLLRADSGRWPDVSSKIAPGYSVDTHYRLSRHGTTLIVRDVEGEVRYRMAWRSG